MKKRIVRSPLFYVGDKRKLMSQIMTYFPNHIDRLIEPFVGGGSVFMNVDADGFLLNDLNYIVIQIHSMLSSYCDRKDDFFREVFSLINKYGLTSRFLGIPQEHGKSSDCKDVNREAYNRMKIDFNSGGKKDIMLLYLLIIYGFNHMIRFNKKGDFNLPVGNLDFNENVYNALNDYFAQTERKQPQWHSQDFKAFLAEIEFRKDDLVYLDPPYLISSSEYNKMWNEECERNLIREMDRLDAMGVRFAVSNAITYRGEKNDIFGDWAKKYNIHPISSNYISYWDNSRKESGEVLVTNY